MDQGKYKRTIKSILKQKKMKPQHTKIYEMAVKASKREVCYWRRSSRGHSHLLIHSWTLTMERFSPPLLSLKCTSCPLFPQLEPYSRKDISFLKRETCNFDHLDGICDWTQFTKDLSLNLHIIYSAFILFIWYYSKNTKIKMNYISLLSWKRPPCLVSIKHCCGLVANSRPILCDPMD